jgi:hypothetical protein
MEWKNQFLEVCVHVRIKYFICILFTKKSYLGETGFYQGRVFGETRSHVNAHIEDGLLTASIVTKEDSYHVEVIL